MINYRFQNAPFWKKFSEGGKVSEGGKGREVRGLVGGKGSEVRGRVSLILKNPNGNDTILPCHNDYVAKHRHTFPFVLCRMARGHGRIAPRCNWD
jgi:hypothetical protein